MKLLTKRSYIPFLGLVAISMGNPKAWTELKFSKIPANKVSYSAEALEIQVENSASPLIYKFENLEKIKEISVELEITGEMNSATFEKWKDFEEDSYLRVGIVAEGHKTLGGFKSLFAPAWVKRMFSLAPAGTGLDKIYFYNVTNNSQLVGKKRTHPSSEYLEEENVALKEPGVKAVKILKVFNPPISSAGLWLSSDGDDSKSKFTVKIKKIEIQK